MKKMRPAAKQILNPFFGVVAMFLLNFAWFGEFDRADTAVESLPTTGLSGAEPGWLETLAQPLLFDASSTRAWRAASASGYRGPLAASREPTP